MRAGTVVLYTDQPERRADLVAALEGLAPCAVLAAAAPAPPPPVCGLVADLDLLMPAPFLGLRTLIAAAPDLPRVFLMRSMGARSLSAARGLGAGVCLPADTPAATVAEALRAQDPDRGPDRGVPAGGVTRSAAGPAPRSEAAGRGRPLPGAAVVVQAADRAGAVIAGLLDAARATGTVDAALVEGGLDPVLRAVEERGLSAWLDTVRAYDDATYQHCLLVAGLAATFAIDLGFTERDRQRLVRAALVHDVGKARIPLAILNKDGPLDAAERAVMRDHAALGHAILVQAGGFDDTVLAVVRWHHEHLDGSGYPDGLSGNQIGDVVRLVTVCDIYAALVERRPYRAPMPTPEALKILYGMDGKLDMALVRAFDRAVSRT
ncbi:HD domain-containing protein [Methylobacterium sp. NEAU 140]|uniref:HD-GYP domain-containing protein n=1 Tax=Methylobacterium sp. NEAU 140 TaxID=3064945 RepID=UPI002736A549|nr:HD domain-containing phosphohydrolase [Methylobacterium sp. NEAU 140]MDP4024329.1 HD domain-containing protein [Methylobacterium sp. NEAU 140]